MLKPQFSKQELAPKQAPHLLVLGVRESQYCQSKSETNHGAPRKFSKQELAPKQAPHLLVLGVRESQYCQSKSETNHGAPRNQSRSTTTTIMTTIDEQDDSITRATTTPPAIQPRNHEETNQQISVNLQEATSEPQKHGQITRTPRPKRFPHAHALAGFRETSPHGQTQLPACTARIQRHLTKA